MGVVLILLAIWPIEILSVGLKDCLVAAAVTESILSPMCFDRCR